VLRGGNLFQDGNFVLIVAYCLVGLATFLVAYSLFQEEQKREVEEQLGESGAKKGDSPLVRFAKPIFNQYFTPMVRGKSIWESKRIKARRRLIAAGLKDQLNPDEFIAFKAFNVLFFPIVAGLLTALDLLSIPWWAIIGSGVAGWFYPDYWVSSRIKQRHKAIRRTLPFVLDLLTLSTEAGLDFVGAIQRVVEKAKPSPMIDELEQVLREIKIGSSRAEALREMALRIDLTEINSFVAILISADQMGASIGKILRQQAEAVRTNRFMLAEREGAKASQKLMAPVMFLMFPAILLLVLGPIAVGFLTNSGK